MSLESRFDQAAAEWDSNPVRVELARAVGEGIRRAVALQRSWRVLDFGAGTGLVTLKLQPYVSSIVAVDASAGMLEKLRQKLAAAGISNVEPQQWDLEKQSFPETGFDLMVSSMTLHHIRDVPLIFQRFASLLKSGGRLAVADLDLEDGSFHGDAEDVFHHGFDREHIRKWLGEAGFSDIAFVDVHHLRKPDQNGHIRSYGIFLTTAQKR